MMRKAKDNPYFRNVTTLLARYEAEFAQMVKNPNTPPDAVAGLMTTINVLRAEKALLSGKG